jgi:hypothetical protein
MLTSREASMRLMAAAALAAFLFADGAVATSALWCA